MQTALRRRSPPCGKKSDGITAGGQRFAGLLVTVVDVNALGLQAAQGLVLTDVWYWDMNDANRAWTKRWQAERPEKLPTYGQAGVYSAVLHYLKVVAALKSDANGKTVVAKMKEMQPTIRCSAKAISARTDAKFIQPFCSR